MESDAFTPDPRIKELQLGKRSISVNGGGDEFEVRSFKVVDGIEDSFKVELKISEDLEIALKYKESAPDNEHRIDITFRIKELVEFMDRNGNGVFDPQEKVSSIVIDNRSMGPIDYRVEDNQDYGLIHVLSTTSEDHVFSIRFYMTAELASITGEGPVVNVTPNEMKFDIDIRGFPFKANDTLLALDARVITREEIDYSDRTIDESIEIASDESGFSFNDPDNVTGAFFSWSNTVEVDGKVGPVIVEIPQNEMNNETKRLSLNYPRGDRIFHDPKVGIVVKDIRSAPEDDNPFEIATWLWAVGFLAVVLTIVSVVSAAIYADNRRFREGASHRDPFDLNDYPYYKGKGG